MDSDLNQTKEALTKMEMKDIYVGEASDELYASAEKLIEMIHPKGSKLSEYEHIHCEDIFECSVRSAKYNVAPHGLYDDFRVCVDKYLGDFGHEYMMNPLKSGKHKYVTKIGSFKYEMLSGHTLTEPVKWHFDSPEGEKIGKTCVETANDVFTLNVYCVDGAKSKLDISEEKYRLGITCEELYPNMTVPTNDRCVIIMPGPYMHKVPFVSGGTRSVVSYQIFPEYPK